MSALQTFLNWTKRSYYNLFLKGVERLTDFFNNSEGRGGGNFSLLPYVHVPRVGRGKHKGVTTVFMKTLGGEVWMKQYSK